MADPLPNHPQKRVISSSLAGAKPPDGMTKAVADAIFVAVTQGANREGEVEIECKLGTLMTRDEAHEPLSLPLGSDAIVFPRTDGRPDGYNVHFSASMEAERWERIKATLDELARKGRATAKPLKVTNDFMHAKGVRVSVDPESNQVLARITKDRLHENINIYQPNTPLDVRVSVVNERPVREAEGDPTMMRVKQRHSYQFEIWSIDLTIVESNRIAHGTKELLSESFEVEIEAADMVFVTQEVEKARRREPNQLLHIADALLNHARYLCKVADRPRPPSGSQGRPPAVVSNGGGGGGGNSGGRKRGYGAADLASDRDGSTSLEPGSVRRKH